ncbi:DnaJ sub A member 3, mitochondrial [Coemansia pectinata]|uniref:DnaJ sub A member 3, mitochondrial n=1 Tax=Coemansia pectinata TaxID=1052879 RepID=A0A9W8L997_9FUNG|nr:DnaJ sub A member 3, mitochondrial [Coemansia pectinata]
MHSIWPLQRRLLQRSSISCAWTRHYATRDGRSQHEAEAIFARLGSDAYQTLGASKESSRGEIKWRYYQLCRDLHPDLHRTDNGIKPKSVPVSQQAWQTLGDEGRCRLLRERFASVLSAYEVLSDAELRQQYDLYRERGRHQPLAPHGSGRAWQVDPWASERPTPPGAASGRRKTREQKLADKQLTFGVFGLLGGMMLVSWFKRQAQYEDELRLAELRHDLSTEALDLAHRRAMEKWREAPPGHVMEYEAKRLAPARPGVKKADELRALWPEGSGLGLIALLDDSQLCGIHARTSVAEDPEVARQRARTRRALESDKIVSRYIALSSVLREHPAE